MDRSHAGVDPKVYPGPRRRMADLLQFSAERKGSPGFPMRRELCATNLCKETHRMRLTGTNCGVKLHTPPQFMLVSYNCEIQIGSLVESAG